MNDDNNKDLVLFLGFCTLLIIAAITLPKGVVVNNEGGTRKNISIGVQQLQQMDSRGIYEVEDEIESVRLEREAENEEQNGGEDNAENGENSEEDDGSGRLKIAKNAIDYTEGVDVKSYNYKAIFANSVVMGDSIAEGLHSYSILDSSSVVARVGASMYNLENEYAAVTSISPRNIFLYYGLNDVGHVEENYELFRTEYENVITRLQQALPNAKIYANLLFPVIDPEHAGSECYADLTPYNNVIKEVCEQYGVVCLDNTGIVKEEFYEPDGMHFTYAFYSYWLYSMALGAGLIQ